MATQLHRRDWLKLVGGALLLPGYGSFEAERGEAYAAWNDPGLETAPELISARAALLAANPHNTVDATGNGAAIRFLGKSAARPTDAIADPFWLAITRGASATGSAMGILSSPSSNTRSAQLSVGRVYQRLALRAQTQGLAVQPLNQLPELRDREETQGLTPTFTRLLEGVMGEQGRRAQMLFRIGIPWDQALQSPRRPLEWVLA